MNYVGTAFKENILPPHVKGLLEKFLFIQTSGNSGSAAPGMRTDYTYYTSATPENPSGEKNLASARYYLGEDLLLTETFHYDADDDILRIVTT